MVLVLRAGHSQHSFFSLDSVAARFGNVLEGETDVRGLV
jgi:hypothetical protein